MEYRVLIVDDEPWSRQVVKSLVEWEKLNLALVGEANEASEGIQLIKSYDPQIVITDMRMPGISGPDFLVELEQQYPDIKIIVLSGYDDFTYMRQAVRSGAADYLLKPADPEELNKTIEKCIAELELRSRYGGLNVSVIFKDSAVLEKYIEQRKRIFACLLELDKAAAAEALQALEKYLTESESAVIDYDTGARVMHDFTLLIEEFMARFGLDSQSIEKLSLKTELKSEQEVFSVLSSKYAEAIDAIKAFQKRKGFLNLSEVKQHLDMYYQEQLSLDTISKLFLVTKEHMSRAFKKEYGITVNEYITSLRMKKAWELIAEDGIEIKETAFLCGYSDLPYFYRVFKKHFGNTPGELRN